MSTHTEVKVSTSPYCDMCFNYGHKVEAKYDVKTILGFWAYMCQHHFELFGVGLGLGKGQRLVT